MLFIWIFCLVLIGLIQEASTYDDRFDKINPPVNISKIHSYIAICTVIKNEQKEDLREWVEYHLRMGVGKFYLHDNGEMPVAPMLTDYIEKEIVHVKEVKDVAPQLGVYHRCIRNYRQLHRWIALIDADEFIATRDQCSIPSVMKKYEDYGGLTLQWRLYGSSGHITRPAGGIIRNYWKCFNFEHIGKSVVNTEYAVSHFGNPHLCHYSHGKYAVDTDFWKIPTRNPHNSVRNSLYEIVWLNHYHLKSKEDYDRNRKRGRASTTEPHKKTEEYFIRTNERCKMNCSILQMPEIKALDCPLSTFQFIQPPSFE